MVVANEPALDRELAMSRVGGDAELLKELGQLFLEEYPRLMRELREAQARKDARMVERAAHGLKGSVANFGAKSAVDAAFRIEQLGRTGDLLQVDGLLAKLDEALLVLHTDLAQL